MLLNTIYLHNFNTALRHMKLTEGMNDPNGPLFSDIYLELSSYARSIPQVKTASSIFNPREDKVNLALSPFFIDDLVYTYLSFSVNDYP